MRGYCSGVLTRRRAGDHDRRESGGHDPRGCERRLTPVFSPGGASVQFGVVFLERRGKGKQRFFRERPGDELKPHRQPVGVEAGIDGYRRLARQVEGIAVVNPGNRIPVLVPRRNIPAHVEGGHGQCRGSENVVCLEERPGPALIDTPMTEVYLAEPGFREQAVTVIPMGRLAEPRDLMATIILLLAEGGAFITGQTIYVDGGRTLV